MERMGPLTAEHDRTAAGQAGEGHGIGGGFGGSTSGYVEQQRVAALSERGFIRKCPVTLNCEAENPPIPPVAVRTFRTMPSAKHASQTARAKAAVVVFEGETPFKVERIGDASGSRQIAPVPDFRNTTGQSIVQCPARRGITTTEESAVSVGGGGGNPASRRKRDRRRRSRMSRARALPGCSSPEKSRSSHCPNPPRDRSPRPSY